MYQIFDTALSSEFPLPELPQSHATQAHYRAQLGDDRVFDEHGFVVAFEWHETDGQVSCTCARRDGEYLFAFPGYARFHLRSDDTIVCLPRPDCSMQTMRHLLLNQVIPRLLASRGSLVLHASAVRLASGRCVAFLGNSGYGKSTLAASFHRHGAELVSDDSILLEPGAQGVTAVGGLPGIRLFSDSMQALFDEATGFAHYTPYTRKQQLLLRREAIGQRCRLDTVFLLEDPARQAPGNAVTVTPVSGAEAMVAMINCAFSLDPTERAVLEQGFRRIGQVVCEQLTFHRLGFPRSHECLADVRQAVLNSVGE